MDDFETRLRAVEKEHAVLDERFTAAVSLLEQVGHKLDEHNKSHTGITTCTTDLDKRVGILELKMGGIQWVVGALVLSTLGIVVAAFWNAVGPFIGK